MVSDKIELSIPEAQVAGNDQWSLRGKISAKPDGVGLRFNYGTTPIPCLTIARVKINRKLLTSEKLDPFVQWHPEKI
jgi:hypothetical protein